MATKQSTTIGIEYDNHGIRAAKVGASRIGKDISYEVESLAEIRGSFTKDEELAQGLAQLKEKIPNTGADKVVSCLAGKQVYAAELPFRRLPDDEMKNALRFEIRKNLPFESAGSTLDYQIVGEESKKSENVQVLVTAVANILLHRQTRALEKAGYKPSVVDVIPTAVANAFRAAHDEAELGAGTSHVALHVGPAVCTVVIDGDGVPFFTRNIYFSAADVLDPESGIAQREKERRLNVLREEIVRSATYYENTYKTAPQPVVHLVGEYNDSSLLTSLFTEESPLSLAQSPMLEHLGAEVSVPKGKFDVAIGLGMRAD